ncbi:hypothetical protein [Halodesulfovibrio marinisediminis]|uniref:Lipoprotein n=1 Tax=Halodesulfovibrio marinisediminis DSM 17456 TaxID=1121457 RepID=A0A1N6EV95_9BACT|nr:hypothetical protein [Halodesulfovibrio marinisediminis]SIN86884.1 hypothetical protein SAMN02745161_0930 [Halodesulfovibrio marinisediminis DSM 17456]
MRARLIFSILALCVMLSGCTLSNMSGTAEPTGGAQAPAESKFMYYNFPDVRVPVEMKADESQMFVHGMGQKQTGVLVFSGNVDFMSLTNAMITTMQQDGWELRFQFTSPRTLLLFTKPTRFAILNITDTSSFSTDLEIWVSPRPEQDSIIEKPLPFLDVPKSSSMIAPKRKTSPAPATDLPAEEGLDS